MENQEEEHIELRPNEKSADHEDNFGLPILKVTKRVQTVSPKTKKKSKEKKERKVSVWSYAFTAALTLIALILAAGLFVLERGTPKQKEFLQTHVLSKFPAIDSLSNQLGFKTQTKDTTTVISEDVNPFGEDNTIQPDSTGGSNPFENDSLTNDSTLEISSQENQNNSTTLVANETSSEESSETSTENTNQFHVVIGLFNNTKNAEDKVKKATAAGYKNAEIIKGNNYYRVVIPFSTKEYTWGEAMNQVKSNLEPAAWVWESKN